MSSLSVANVLFVTIAAAVAPIAVLDSGPIFGVQTSLPGALAPVNKFLGVPFADPPVRFTLAKPPKKWVTPRNATDFRDSCPTAAVNNPLAPGGAVLGELTPPRPESEDCLYINVFTPAQPASPRNGRPIIIFIPGGGFQAGSGITDLSAFAAYEDVVAMGFNYRTNIFGFPDSPHIPVAERNLGLHDQRLALSWAQSNAAAFGGDPSKVTIWGGSAGSMSVDYHIRAYAKASPAPFRAAILSSGQGSFGPLATMPRSGSNYSLWNTVSQAVGCATAADNMACMRNVSVATFQQKLSATQSAFVPIWDNLTMPSAPSNAWKTGKVAKIPLLVSNVAEEGRVLVDRKVTKDQFIQSFLSAPLVTPAQRDAILAHYQAKPNLQTDFDVIAAIYTDYVWICPQNNMASAASSLKTPTWRAYFNASTYQLFGPQYSWLGAFHGSDVLLLTISPTLEGKAVPGLTPNLYTLGSYFRGALARFVKNPLGGTGWPAIGSSYAPFDYGVLGNVSTTVTGGATPEDERVIGAACYLYKDMYDAIEVSTG